MLRVVFAIIILQLIKHRFGADDNRNHFPSATSVLLGPVLQALAKRGDIDGHGITALISQANYALLSLLTPSLVV
jgi:hypothetical protein